MREEELEAIVTKMFTDLWDLQITPQELEIILVSIFTRVFLNCLDNPTQENVKSAMDHYTAGVLRVMQLGKPKFII